jgi:hypothetical protein
MQSPVIMPARAISKFALSRTAVFTHDLSRMHFDVSVQALFLRCYLYFIIKSRYGL